VLLDSALEGYSSTIFAYGQTGSGKTYTMAGVEENLGRADYASDETDGIIPRAVSYMWQQMSARPEKYFVKAAFFEIYNEQLRDLLNPASGPLHCRWNTKQGFFVEDLLVVDCTSIDDLIAVLHEGMRNRKQGSHELNKDSSRSHSILTVYFISETVAEDGHSYKKYGKGYFVDLAGSERLRESKSSGGMLKETGNINRSLFVLGKVISSLGDGRSKGLKPHVPYRDSKLTMLLMDSLGGNSKALMIACISPAASYVEETMSTLNYATRAMNIKNKPLLQVDSSEQLIMNMRREAQLLRLENEYLKDQLNRASGGMPPLMVDFANSYNQEGQPNPAYQELQFELSKLKEENARVREQRDGTETFYHKSMLENQSLHMKLENLESAFVGSVPVRGSDGTIQAPKISREYTISTLLNENTNLKKRLKMLQEEQAQLQYQMEDPGGGYFEATAEDAGQLQSVNEQLQKRLEFYQKRERELLEHLVQAQKTRKPSGKVST
jgi:hypothetical protein